MPNPVKGVIKAAAKTAKKNNYSKYVKAENIKAYVKPESNIKMPPKKEYNISDFLTKKEAVDKAIEKGVFTKGSGYGQTGRVITKQKSKPVSKWTKGAAAAGAGAAAGYAAGSSKKMGGSTSKYKSGGSTKSKKK